MAGVPGSKLTAYTNAHVDSPLQKSYDPEVEKSYDEHAKVFHRDVLSDGITMSPSPGNEPLPVGETTWYGVGGATDPGTGSRHPEVSYRLSHASTQFTHAEVLGHLLRTEGMNIDRSAGRTTDGQVWRPAFAGGWNETDDDETKAVLDYSDVYEGKGARRQALDVAADRGERAVFDAKRIKDIPVRPR